MSTYCTSRTRALLGWGGRPASTWIDKLAAALFRKARPEAPYMAITGYFDESGTHGRSSSTLIVGGFLATEFAWSAYEVELKELLRVHAVDYFHAKKLRARSGPFKKWSIPQQRSFGMEFFRLVDKHLSYGVSVSLSPKDYDEIYKAKSIPKKVRRDTQYGLCFRMCMVAAAQFMSKQPDELPLTVVLEGGHKNSGDAVRIFGELKDAFPSEFFGPLVIEGKRQCLPLAAADALVHTIFRSSSTGVAIPETKTSVTSIVDGVPSTISKPTCIQNFTLTPKTMADLSALHFDRSKPVIGSLR